MATISPRKVENCCSIRTQFKSNIASKKSFSYLFEHFTFCICAHRIFLIYGYGGCTNDSISLQAYGIRFIMPRVWAQCAKCVYVWGCSPRPPLADDSLTAATLKGRNYKAAAWTGNCNLQFRLRPLSWVRAPGGQKNHLLSSSALERLPDVSDTPQRIFTVISHTPCVPSVCFNNKMQCGYGTALRLAHSQSSLWRRKERKAKGIRGRQSLENGSDILLY